MATDGMAQEFFHIELTKSIQIAVPLFQTAEVLTVEPIDLCPIPGVVPALAGVVNQRGRLLWVVDLEQLLGLKPVGASKLQRSPALVISLQTDMEDFRVACLTRQLRGIIACPESDISPVPSRLEQRMQQFFSAWLRPPGYSLLKLDVEALLAAIQLSAPSTTMALL